MAADAVLAHGILTVTGSEAVEMMNSTATRDMTVLMVRQGTIGYLVVLETTCSMEAAAMILFKPMPETIDFMVRVATTRILAAVVTTALRRQ
jgi:hypothetical protein